MRMIVAEWVGGAGVSAVLEGEAHPVRQSTAAVPPPAQLYSKLVGNHRLYATRVDDHEMRITRVDGHELATKKFADHDTKDRASEGIPPLRNVK